MISVPTCVRTLTAAGFQIVGASRHPASIIVHADRIDRFGRTLPYSFLVFDREAPITEVLEEATRQARIDGRVLVCAALEPGESWLSWPDFLESLGGAVPLWRALSPDFGDQLLKLGENRLPDGWSGEPWRHFEEAARDALEFCLARKVVYLGASHRGEAVSDLVAHTPDDKVVLVDLKAAQNGFDVGADSLRPLREYSERQRQRQHGGLHLASVLLVANQFRQREESLLESGNRFMAQVGLPLAFLRTGDLVSMVGALHEKSSLRNKIRWGAILCRIGEVPIRLFTEEIEAAEAEHVDREGQR